MPEKELFYMVVEVHHYVNSSQKMLYATRNEDAATADTYYFKSNVSSRKIVKIKAEVSGDVILVPVESGNFIKVSLNTENHDRVLIDKTRKKFLLRLREELDPFLLTLVDPELAQILKSKVLEEE